ncbi:MAG: amidohydrolase family protein [Gemmatimonadetes bacterium]|nr:amidohydrolase family protein [Gemmatimonadota bacterium]
MGLLLRNVCWHSLGATRQGDIRIGRGRVVGAARRLAPRRGERVLDAADYTVLPGLINAHDHLELDVFPRMGRPPYRDFYEWAREIYRPQEPPVRELLRIPLADRLWWGAYRNLLGGVTTVVHHNPYYRRVFGRRFPVKVLRHCRWAHSLGYSRDLTRAAARRNGCPFVIHAAEGVGEESAGEVERLHRLGLLGPGTVLVHAIAVPPAWVARLGDLGVAVVWCPASNIYLFGRTAAVAELKTSLRVCLGTDSTLSGSATLLEEARAACATGLATPAEILEMLTTRGADVFGLRDGRGTLETGAPADLVLLRKRGEHPAATLVDSTAADVGLVLVDGRPRLAEPAFAAELDAGRANVRIAGAPRWLYGSPVERMERMAAAAGEEALRQNPVWSLLEAA